MSEHRKTVAITNNRGLHARASAKFVTYVSKLPEGLSVKVGKDGTEVTGTSIMGLMMLGAAKGDSVEIIVEGHQAETALEKLAGLVVDGFGED
ncbi:MAG: HPr family phosphocarrier protein [Parasphingorhabdus sp.]|uniref:HPr family phosphocarrier protein n=1 Tax=Alphaproteobacteria TaxID=28211 RepID=UPI003298C4A2